MAVEGRTGTAGAAGAGAGAATLARRLTAPAAGWVVRADAIVVGSGVAGLTAALRLRTRVPRVLLVTKGPLSSGSTVWAQGGIAAALDPSDSPGAHLADTLVAGVGLCDTAAVEVLVTEGPTRVRELMGLGARFDTQPDGGIALTREGGHHADRIAHAGGDATGAEISRALVAQLEAVRNDPGIEVIENALVVDLLTAAPDADGRPGPVCGATLHVIGQGSRDGVGAALAPAVILATGGIGQVYPSSTNPARGDRGRHRRRAAGRRGGGRRRVRAVPPDGAVARLGGQGPAHADLRGGARRGRRAAGHRRAAVHAAGARDGRARAA